MTDAPQPQVSDESTREVPENSSSRLPAVFKSRLPPLVAEADPEAQERFLEFFAAQIRNENTRSAYGRAANSSSGPVSRDFP